MPAAQSSPELVPAPALPYRPRNPKQYAPRIGLLGCGVVGGGVIRLLNENKSYLELRVGAPIEVRHVLVGHLRGLGARLLAQASVDLLERVRVLLVARRSRLRSAQPGRRTGRPRSSDPAVNSGARGIS